MCPGAVCLEGKVLITNSAAFLSSDVYVPPHLSTASPFPWTHNPRLRLWEAAENPAEEGLWERRWGFWLSWELRSKAEVMTLSCWDTDPLLTLHSQALLLPFPSHLWEQDVLLSSETSLLCSWPLRLQACAQPLTICPIIPNFHSASFFFLWVWGYSSVSRPSQTETNIQSLLFIYFLLVFISLLLFSIFSSLKWQRE